MATPFNALRPALEVLVSEANVLPATGQALEDYVTPDLEEVYDRVTGGRNPTEALWETRRKLYHPLRLTPCTERPLFRYFLDDFCGCCCFPGRLTSWLCI